MTSDAVSLLGVDDTGHAYGGRLCLALVNSVWWRRSEAPEDQLHSYADLVHFVAGAGWLPDPAAVLALAEAQRVQARRSFARALRLRDDLHAVFSAHAAGVSPPDESMRAINALGAAGLAALRLVPESAGYRLGWTEPAIDLPAQQVAASALVLLGSAELERVKQCPGPACGWVFLDVTRNGSRRWCNTAECGNRSRVKAHYDRSRAVPRS